MALPIHPQQISAFKFLFNPIPNPKVSKYLTVLRIVSRTRGGPGAGARVSVKSWVSQLDQNMTLYGQFSAPVKQETKASKEEEEKQNYYVNMGYAIRSLREGFRDLYYRELCFDIYRDDIVLKNPLNTFVGIENYKSSFWAL